MIIFVTALSAEARSIISKFGLKQKWNFNHQTFYSLGKFGLITTGIGKVASATGVARVLTKLSDVQLMINVGICGAKSKQTAAGSIFAVRSIKDHSTGRRYLPDIIFRHDLPETELETWDHPVTKKHINEVQADVVDMEASGFYEAASQQLQSHQIQCLKIVSDHLEARPPKVREVRELINNNIPAIENFADKAEPPAEEQHHILDDQDEAELDDMFNRWRCTTTQQRFLRQSLAYARLRDGTRLSDITIFHRESENSRQRAQLVDELRKELTKR